MGHGIHVLEEEGCRSGATEDDGGLEPPELVGIDRATPAVDERARRGTGRLDAIDQSRDVVANLLRGAHRQPLGANDRQGE